MSSMKRPLNEITRAQAGFLGRIMEEHFDLEGCHLARQVPQSQ